MTISASELRTPKAVDVRATDDELAIDLSDGRTIIVPLGWYPRLAYGSAKERKRWRLIANGEGIHWPDLDEDLNVEGLLAGRPSGESQRSFQRWLESRGASGKKQRNARR